MAIPDGYSALDGSERPRPDTHRLVGPVQADEIIGVSLILRPRPGSPPLPGLDAQPGQARILTPEEYARTYGAAEADLDAVTAFAVDHGLTVTERHAGRRIVTVTGTAAQLNAAFGITLNYYEAPRPPAEPHRQVSPEEEEEEEEEAAEAPPALYTHHGYDGTVHVPASLAGIVQAVVGLDNRSLGGAGAVRAIRRTRSNWPSRRSRSITTFRTPAPPIRRSGSSRHRTHPAAAGGGCPATWRTTSATGTSPT
jgi:hypothetical protein